MGINILRRTALAIALLAFPLFVHCGGGSSGNGSISATAGQSNMAVGVHLPSGFTYDHATGTISGQFARMGVSNPKAYVGQAYITQIDVTRTGGTLPSQTISLTGTPPPTSASFTVTPEEVYNFSATIYTNLSAPLNAMSGGTLSPVTAPPNGQATSVDINIPGFNRPPVVTFTSDNMTPGAGTAYLSCSSVDPDDDAVTYQIRAVSTPVGANSFNINSATAGNSYAYTTGIASQIDLECIATDAYGAIGYGQLSLNYGDSVVAPIAPTGVTAIGADAQVTVSWSASTGAASYNLYWSATAPVTKASAKITGVKSPYIYTGLTNGTPYYCAITAVNPAGESGLSAEVSATPTPAVVAPIAPTGVTAVGADAQVTVSWTASAGATSYNIYWSATPGVTTANTKITGATSPYIHPALTNGTPYYYAVTAVNTAGESGLSVEVSATPQMNAPTGITAVGANTQVTVSWSPVVGATSYNLYWSATPGVTTASTKITGATSPYIHTGCTHGAPYYFAVTAVTGGIEGAISVEATATPAEWKVTKTADTNDGVCDIDCSLREAITAANSGAGGETINIPAGTYTTTIAGFNEGANATGDFDIAKSVTITGAGTGTTTINGGGLDRIFHITGAYTVTISDVTITGGNSNGNNGSGIYNEPGGTLTATNVTISGNTELGGGGGIFNNGTLLTVTDSLISGNTANAGGGGIYSNTTLSVINSTISGNNAGNLGGGICNVGTLTVTNSSINGNSTATYGGGIYNQTGIATVTNSTLSSNTAGNAGGGIYNESGTLTVTSSIISANPASTGGGVANNFGGSVTITSSTISGHSTTSMGGGINNWNGTLTVTSSTISGNTAGPNTTGGGIYNGSTLTVTNSTISGNATSGAAAGGGIYNFSGSATVTNSTISGNSSPSGGGIYNNGGTTTLSNTIVANQSTGGDCVVNAGSIVSNGYNLDSDATCGVGALQNTNPLLGALANNGGPTQTMALSVGSPAIDTGSCVTATDQIGTPRPQGGGCDIGAYEFP
ncbi:MAG: fibronectin type III domain-containing protein [Nitrospinae bacterium]|nr:fibronectin type III domain-containing protein [Nitrospinota bacterium]